MSLNNPADMSQSDMRPSRVWHVTRPTCATCKYYVVTISKLECTNNAVQFYAKDGWGHEASFVPPAEFGCNQWESK